MQEESVEEIIQLDIQYVMILALTEESFYGTLICPLFVL